MKKGWLSVIIPAYNTGKWVRGQLNQLKAQMSEYPNVEIIVVDDGSSEDMGWVKDYPNAVLKRKRNGGAASARNAGIDLAHGEYITFLDSDDEIYDNYLSIIFENMRAGWDWVSYDWHCDGHKEWAEQTNDPLMINCAVWAYSFRAEIIGDNRFIEKMVLAEDQEWLHRVLKPDCKHFHDHRIFYNYRWIGNDNSVVHRYLRGELGKERNTAMVAYKNVLFIGNINSIGGIESMLYYLGKKYGSTHDITVFYRTGDATQIDRLREYIRVKKWNDNMHIKCEKAFFNLDVSCIGKVDANEYIQVIHADYKAYKLKYVPHPDITGYIAVSDNNRKAFKELTGIDATVCHNPIVLEKPRKVLHLISATRLTWEKGRKRMEQLAEALDSAGIPYMWDIYTCDGGVSMRPNVTYRKPRLDIADYIADADYLVQLSDTEGWSYTIYEALCLGTPVIVTDFPSAHEMGIENGKNGFILPMDMSAIPLDDIYKGLRKFKYEPVADGWDKLLAPGKSNYAAEMKKPVHVTTKRNYFDIPLNKNMEVGEKQTVTMERAEKLMELGLVEMIE